MKHVLGGLLLLFLLCSPLKAQSFSKNASLWDSMSDSNKFFYVDGFKDNTNTVYPVSNTLYKFKFIENLKNLTDEQKNLFKSIYSSSIEYYLKIDDQIKALDNKDIIKQMDVLYKNKDNRNIPINLTCSMAMDMLLGNDISKRLDAARSLYNKR